MTKLLPSDWPNTPLATNSWNETKHSSQPHKGPAIDNAHSAGDLNEAVLLEMGGGGGGRGSTWRVVGVLAIWNKSF